MTENTEEELVEIGAEAWHDNSLDGRGAATPWKHNKTVEHFRSWMDQDRANMRAALTAICGKLGTTPEGLAETFERLRGYAGLDPNQEAKTPLEVLTFMADLLNVHQMGDTIHADELSSIRAESTRLRESLKRIAAQKLADEARAHYSAELGEDWDGDWEGGYDAIITEARTALSSPDVQSTE